MHILDRASNNFQCVSKQTETSLSKSIGSEVSRREHASVAPLRKTPRCTRLSQTTILSHFHTPLQTDSRPQTRSRLQSLQQGDTSGADWPCGLSKEDMVAANSAEGVGSKSSPFRTSSVALNTAHRVWEDCCCELECFWSNSRAKPDAIVLVCSLNALSDVLTYHFIFYYCFRCKWSEMRVPENRNIALDSKHPSPAYAVQFQHGAVMRHTLDVTEACLQFRVIEWGIPAYKFSQFLPRMPFILWMQGQLSLQNQSRIFPLLNSIAVAAAFKIVVGIFENKFKLKLLQPFVIALQSAQDGLCPEISQRLILT